MRARARQLTHLAFVFYFILFLVLVQPFNSNILAKENRAQCDSRVGHKAIGSNVLATLLLFFFSSTIDLHLINIFVAVIALLNCVWHNCANHCAPLTVCVCLYKLNVLQRVQQPFSTFATLKQSRNSLNIILFLIVRFNTEKKWNSGEYYKFSSCFADIERKIFTSKVYESEQIGTMETRKNRIYYYLYSFFYCYILRK